MGGGGGQKKLLKFADSSGSPGCTVYIVLASHTPVFPYFFPFSGFLYFYWEADSIKFMLNWGKEISNQEQRKN